MAQLKDEVIQMIERLPDDAGISDIMAELYFRQRVDAGLKELDEGKGISHDQIARTPGEVAKLVWSPRSVADLTEICGVHRPRFSSLLPTLCTEGHYRGGEPCAISRSSGRVVPEYQRPDLRELIFQNYRIVYRVKTDYVEVAAVVHGARLLSKRCAASIRKTHFPPASSSAVILHFAL